MHTRSRFTSFEFRSSRPVAEYRLHGGIGPVIVKGIVAMFQFGTVGGFEMAAPVGERTVDVRETVFVGEAPGAEDTAGFFEQIFICQQSGNGATGKEWRFGGEVVWVLLRGVAPVFLG